LQKDAEGHRHAFAPILAGAEHPTFGSINRLAREYERKEYFDSAWALRPVERVSFGVHEINQPIGAARNNAHAALRFLAREPPYLAEVREALD
jgi:hypothetical protein